MKPKSTNLLCMVCVCVYRLPSGPSSSRASDPQVRVSTRSAHVTFESVEFALSACISLVLVAMASVVIGRPRQDVHNSGASSARVPATLEHLVAQLDHGTSTVVATIFANSAPNASSVPVHSRQSIASQQFGNMNPHRFKCKTI